MIRAKNILASLCLIAGISIYLLFRSRNHLVFMVIDALGVGGVVDSLRMSVAGIEVPDFVRYCLPDGLWSMSYILFIDNVFIKEPLMTRLLWCSAIPVIGTCSELLQLVSLLPGVYDPLDLVAYLMPLVLYVMAVSITKLTKRRI